MQPVARQAAVRAQCVHAFHHGMPLSSAAIGQQQADGDLAAQQRLYVQFGVGCQAIQRQRIQFGNTFTQAHALDGERCVQGRAHLQEAGVLGEGGGIQAAEAGGRMGAVGHGAGRSACGLQGSEMVKCAARGPILTMSWYGAMAVCMSRLRKWLMPR